MGNVLRNPRHERYAQGIVAGLTRQEAYAQAGFHSKNGSSAARVLHNQPHVQARIKELMDNVSRRSELSRKEILDRILQDWDLSRKLGQMSAALKAGDMLGRELHKMFVERKEIGGAGDFDNKSEDELREIIRNDMKDLGWDEDTIPPDPSAIN